MHMVLVKCIGDVGRRCSHRFICINGIVNILGVVYNIGRFTHISNNRRTGHFVLNPLGLSD